MAPPDRADRAPSVASPAFLDDPRLIAPRAAVRVDLGNGGFVLRSPAPLAPYARCVGEWLEHWAAATPDALAFAEPAAGGDGWRRLAWGELRRQVGAVAQGLLDLELPAGKPLVVLSDNALDHLVLLLAGMHIGRAVCTVSSAYCRLAQSDYGRITAILQALDPALVYASTSAVYGAALAASEVGAVAVFSEGADAHPGALPFARLLAARETPAVMQAYAAITPDTHAKYLLTSGSTGSPKVVINTQRMLCANQQMLAQTLRFLDVERPVLLDWLPWSHTFGGNHNVNIVLRSGGTMYIDDGRPLPGAIERTIAHLREVQPTIYFNVPRGYEMLLPALESDAALARHFFGRLRMAFYAGAGMPLSTWQRLEAAAARVRDEPLWLTTSWGSTETAPAITFANWKLDRPGVIGLPLAGAEVKFVPNAGKLEMRVRGDHIFPGYRDNEEATRAAFDDEGYYRIGDAGHLLDSADPLSGIVFNGRVAEDFKLTSGTWVSVGTLRVRVVSALAPYAQDVVITGHDRSEIGALIFLTEAGRALPSAQIAEHVRAGLRQLRDEGGGSSQTPARAMLLSDAPDAASGEITDKGYVNQRLVLARRADFVHALHAEPLDPRVIRP
ncbi:MAG: feruloyl-CoA synthase [Burkholderiales bacterium]|nr:feruloyl-CoA synthase [Burkholderiales bacterium]